MGDTVRLQVWRAARNYIHMWLTNDFYTVKLSLLADDFLTVKISLLIGAWYHGPWRFAACEWFLAVSGSAVSMWYSYISIDIDRYFTKYLDIDRYRYRYTRLPAVCCRAK